MPRNKFHSYNIDYYKFQRNKFHCYNIDYFKFQRNKFHCYNIGRSYGTVCRYSANAGI